MDWCAVYSKTQLSSCFSPSYFSSSCPPSPPSSLPGELLEDLVELSAGLDLVRQLHVLALLNIAPCLLLVGPKPHRLAFWLLSFLLLCKHLLRLQHLDRLLLLDPL